MLRWAETGVIPEASVDEALDVAGVTPGAREWRSFLDRLLLWSGATFLAVATIFFVAFNWRDLGRFAKFGLAEFLILAGTIAFAKLGADRTSGKAALLFASLVMGALLALFGQTYQTGADPWQLFASWGGLILPWVIVGQFAGLWMLWIAIVKVGLALHFLTFGGLFGIFFGTERLLWTLFAFNAACLVIWELAASRVSWLNERWAPRLLAAAGAVIVTGLALYAIGGWDDVSGLALVIYPVWAAALYTVYRRQTRDLFMLAGGCLSIIVTVTTFLSRHLLRNSDDAAAFLFISLLIIGMASAAAVWLRSVAIEEAE